MSGYSQTRLPCGHRAAYRDSDPAEGVYLNHCERCDWRRKKAPVVPKVEGK